MNMETEPWRSCFGVEDIVNGKIQALGERGYAHGR